MSLGLLTHCAAGCSVPVVVEDPPATCFYAGCDVMIDGEASFLQPDKMSLSECNRAYEIPNKELWELYELQHTPAFGWQDGYDDDLLQHYQVVGWTDEEWSVCDGW